MYIQRHIFLLTTSKKIKLIEIQEITYRKIPLLNKAYDNTLRVYNQAGLNIQGINADPEFKPTEDTLKDIAIKVNYATVQENVI